MSDENLVAREAGGFDVNGRVTFDTVPAIYARSRSMFSGNGPLTLNLAGVVLADSAGVALLLEWQQEARAANRSLTFKNFPEQVRRVIRVTGLNEAFGLA